MNLEERRSRGTGLGMLSIQERVRLLNGTLEWRSTPGAGSSVIARLPMPTDQP
jgi:signal transduction histidine kinase